MGVFLGRLFFGLFLILLASLPSFFRRVVYSCHILHQYIFCFLKNKAKLSFFDAISGNKSRGRRNCWKIREKTVLWKNHCLERKNSGRHPMLGFLSLVNTAACKTLRTQNLNVLESLQQCSKSKKEKRVFFVWFFPKKILRKVVKYFPSSKSYIPHQRTIKLLCKKPLKQRCKVTMSLILLRLRDHIKLICLS